MGIRPGLSPFTLPREGLEEAINMAIERGSRPHAAPAFVSGVAQSGKTMTCTKIRADRPKGAAPTTVEVTVNRGFFKDLTPDTDAVVVRLLTTILQTLERSQPGAIRRLSIWHSFREFRIAYEKLNLLQCSFLFYFEFI